MLILGIDPGTATTGYGIVELKGNKYASVAFGVIKTSPDLPLENRLFLIHREIERLIKTYRPSEVAIEELFFNKNVRTALAVGHARGVILLAASQQATPVFEYTPLQVKQGVVGYGRAEKKQVQFMVKTILGLDKMPKPDDAADALAIAICHGNCASSPLARNF